MKRTDKQELDKEKAEQFIGNSLLVDKQEALQTTDENLKKFLLRLPEKTYRAIKIKSAETDKSMQELILTAIEKNL